MTDCPPLLIFASTLVSSPCQLESPPPVDIDLHYNKCSLFLNSLFLALRFAGGQY